MQPDMHARIREIGDVLPCAVESIRLHEQGWQFLVIEVNGEWIFRFARSEDCRAVQVEASFLKRFSELSPLPVPLPVFVGPGFTGYRKIRGEPLTRDAMSALGTDVRRVIAGQVAAFLRALHSFPLDAAEGMGMALNWDGWPGRAARTIREAILPLISPASRQNALDSLAKSLSPARHGAVVHGDLCPTQHVLFDAQDQHICGVIDFGHMTIAEPAVDFAPIAGAFGYRFLAEVIALYAGKPDRDLRERVRARLRAAPLFEAAYAMESGRKEYLTRCLARIEQVFGQSRKAPEQNGLLDNTSRWRKGKA